jgi:PIN domain nuclease of toxin-antitoxin system
MILIDTHVLIWFLSGHTELTLFHRKKMCKALELKQLFLSAISIWEIAVKERSGNLDLLKPLNILLQEIESVICVIPLTAEILYSSVYLPGDFHKDPADRIIISTALSGNYQLITYDKKILEYSRQGHLTCL